MIAMASVVAGSLVLLGTFIGRVRRSRTDTSPYECGMPPFERVQTHRFPMHFYLVAMLFILFDIEVAFLLPWAVSFRGFEGARGFVLGEMLVFIGILVVGFVYL